MKLHKLLGGVLIIAVIGSINHFGREPRLVIQGCQFPQEMKSVFNQGLPPAAGGVVSDFIVRSAVYSRGGRTLEVHVSEKNPVSGQWERDKYTYTTSFDISCVTSNPGGRFLYIAGIKTDTNCNDIVEQWKFPLTTGSYQVFMIDPPTSIGTPRGPYSAYVDVQGGGPYIPHAQRPNYVPFPQKKELITGDFGHFDMIVTDPELRYLLLHSFSNGHIYKLPLLQPYTLELEASSAVYPHLNNIFSMSVFDHASLGRFIHLSEMYLGNVPETAVDTVMLDSNNDGNFDSVTTYDFEDWINSGYDDDSEWLSPYRVDYSDPD